jgi:hypothetical protein
MQFYFCRLWRPVPVSTFSKSLMNYDVPKRLMLHHWCFSPILTVPGAFCRALTAVRRFFVFFSRNISMPQRSGAAL